MSDPQTLTRHSLDATLLGTVNATEPEIFESASTILKKVCDADDSDIEMGNFNRLFEEKEIQTVVIPIDRLIKVLNAVKRLKKLGMAREGIKFYVKNNDPIKLETKGNAGSASFIIANRIEAD